MLRAYRQMTKSDSEPPSGLLWSRGTERKCSVTLTSPGSVVADMVVSRRATVGRASSEDERMSVVGAELEHQAALRKEEFTGHPGPEIAQSHTAR